MKNDLLEKKRKSHIEIGEIYFWTATINKWKHLLSEDKYKEVILKSLEYLSNKNTIEVFAFVIMPNHIHVIWRVIALNKEELPHHSFLKFTAHTFKKMIQSDDKLRLQKFSVNRSNKLYEFWQRDSLAIHLYTQNVAYQKLDYLHNNPISAHWNLSMEPSDYYYSSARFYEEGIKDFTFLKDLREEFY